jgi:Transposase DDE domain
VAASLPPTAWQTLTVAQGAHGPRTYQFVARRVWERRDGLPGRACWLVLRRNLDGREARYYLSNAPEDTPLLTLAQVAAARWVIETEFETAKGETGLDEYEVRSWAGWHHHITLALLAATFLLTLQQDWGEKMSQLTRPQVSRVLRELLPHRTWTRAELLQWLRATQERNARAKESHIKRRLRRQHERASLPLVA